MNQKKLASIYVKAVWSENLVVSGGYKQKDDGTVEKFIDKREVKYTAWYAPEIPISNGPMKFGGLPGLILEMNLCGQSKLICTEIIINPKNPIKIKRPKKGKEMTMEEFDKMTGSK